MTLVAVELDDFSPKNANLFLLEDIKEHIPDFKVTVFAVPWEIRFGEPTPITEWKNWCNVVKDLDWLEFCLHGFTHVPHEFKEISFDEAKKRILSGEKMFQNCGIKLKKIFKAPYWELSEAGKRAAEELGYKVVEDGYYNWNLKDQFPQGVEKIIAHGHIQNTCGNGLEESVERILSIPVDTKFKFISEVL